MAVTQTLSEGLKREFEVLSEYNNLKLISKFIKYKNEE